MYVYIYAGVYCTVLYTQLNICRKYSDGDRICIMWNEDSLFYLSYRMFKKSIE